MKKSRYIASLMISSLLALTIPSFINPHKADASDSSENLCSRAVVGTYLATANQTNSTSGKPSSYREIITLTADGNLIANDSNAGGVPGSSNPNNQPFSPIQGSWKCNGNNKIIAKTFNFSFPSGSLAGNIVLTEYQLTFNPRTGTVNGNGKFSFFGLNNSPLDQNTKPLPIPPFEFSYQAVKIKAD
ncbi:MAG: hypothetical protein V7L14_26755 [Nostoc sp.]|uniref:hypothetical protein n=1 Tax=Nostoc sp. TaxID=1180 RepID=UPI002FF45113